MIDNRNRRKDIKKDLVLATDTLLKTLSRLTRSLSNSGYIKDKHIQLAFTAKWIDSLCSMLEELRELDV